MTFEPNGYVSEVNRIDQFFWAWNIRTQQGNIGLLLENGTSCRLCGSLEQLKTYLDILEGDVPVYYHPNTGLIGTDWTKQQAR